MTLRTAIIELAIMAGVGLLLALLGPFGTFAMAGFAERLVYWLGLTVGGWAVYRPAMMAAQAVSRRLDLPEAAAWVAACLLATGPMTVIVWLTSFRHTPRVWPSLSNFVDTYATVLIIGAAITLIFWFRRVPVRSQRPAPLIASDPKGGDNQLEDRTGGGSRFLDRLPPHLGTDLLALEMEDHYLRAHTALGSTLILLRMRDALAELDGLAGAQVHRSWWVARAAVTSGEAEGRNQRLRLSNGLTVPVARATVPLLAASGWPVQARA